MRKWGILWVGVLGLGLITTFQNCAKVPLEQALPAVAPFNVEGTIDLCLQGTLANYTVDSLLISNLNMTPSRGAILEDSDSDGIADVDEAGLGFNPLNRRSNGKVLDSLCLDVSGSYRCEDDIPACNPSSTILGINDCDIKTLRLQTLFGHPTQGLDSDKDGIVDVMEILLGTSPNINDRNDDPDHDGVPNWLEVQRGTNPHFTNSGLSGENLLTYSSSKMSNRGDCTGELWKVTVTRLPLAQVVAYQDASGSTNPLSPDLSHEENENVVTVFLKLKTQAGYSGNSKVYFKDFKINKNVKTFSYRIEDFKAAGEVLP